jgi:hypothetical protein
LSKYLYDDFADAVQDVKENGVQNLSQLARIYHLSYGRLWFRLVQEGLIVVKPHTCNCINYETNYAYIVEQLRIKTIVNVSRELKALNIKPNSRPALTNICRKVGITPLRMSETKEKK